MSARRRRFPYGSLLWEMTYAEVRLRDQGSVLGFLWTLLHPALMFAVLYGLFLRWMGRFVPDYAAYLLIGLILWNFFQKATTYAMGSLRRYRGLLRNYRFPREILVFSAVAAVLWSTLLELCVLTPLLALLGHPPAWAWVTLPLLLLLFVLFVGGLSLFLAVLSAEYQDMERIWDLAATALFYLTPVFYPARLLSEGRRTALLWSPLTQIITAFRETIIAGEPPAWKMFARLLAAAVLTFAIGLWTLRRLEFRIADKLMV